MSSRSRRAADSRGMASVSRGPPSSSSPTSSPADANQHIHLNIKLPSSKLREATTTPSKRNGGWSRSANDAGSNKRSSRGVKKSYVVPSDSDEEEEPDEEEEDDEPDEEEEEEGEDEIEVGDVTAVTAANDEDEEDEDMGDLRDEDAEGEEVEEDEMDVDAEGEDDDGDEDAEGDIDMDLPPPTIKISKPSKSTPSGKGKGAAVSKPSSRPTASARFIVPDDDDDELSELESGAEEINNTVEVGGGEQDAEGEDEDMDAEGEEIEVEVAEGEEEPLDSDDDGSRAETPDLSRMTARQRAKHGDVVHEYMKLSDEVQVKKHLTAEELSMRRAEMARRRRNLSEKRNEEVKMETINKLLKKQAPKPNRRVALLPGEDSPDSEQQRANPVFVRWINTKQGSKLAIPDDMVAGPMAPVFGLGGGKMVEEVL